jgi:hypothetical protein
MFVDPAPLDDSDIVGLMSEADGYKWFSVLSHLAFLVPLALSWRYRNWLVFTLTFFAMFISTFYHTCAEFDVCAAVPLFTWRVLDRETATLILIAFVSLYIGPRDDDFKPRTVEDLRLVGREAAARMYEADATNVENLDVDEADVGQRFDLAVYHVQFARIFPLVAVLATTIALFIYQLDMYVAYVCLVASLLSLLVYDNLFHMERNIPIGDKLFVVNPRQVHIWFTVATLVTGAIAIVFFLLPAEPPGTSLLHSFWHVFGALALSFGILSKEMRPQEPLVAIEVLSGQNGREDWNPTLVRRQLLSRFLQDHVRDSAMQSSIQIRGLHAPRLMMQPLARHGYTQMWTT